MLPRVGRLVTVLVGTVLVGVAVTALVAPRPPFTTYRQPVVVAATAAFLLVGLLVRPPPRLRRVLRSRWTPWVVAALGGWLAVVVGTSLTFPWSWDVGVADTLSGLLHTGKPLEEFQVAYLSRYPNTHPLIAVHRAAHAVTDATGWPTHTVLVTAVGVAAGLSVLLVHALVSPVAGRVRAVAAQLVVVALVATSPWMAVPYTDVLAMPLLTGSVVLVLRAARRFDGWSVAYLLASAALAAGAIVLKATPAVLLVAVALVGLMLAVDEWRRWRRALAALAATVVWVGVTLALVSSLTASATRAVGPVPPTGLRPDARPPVLWWVANGMTPTTSAGAPPRYGGYNGVMLRAIEEMDSAQATEWAREWIEHQWARRGLDDLTVFYLDKAAWNWGDGMFWAWGEGRDGRPETLPPARSGVARFVHDVDGRYGRWYPLRSDLAQGLWLALLLVTGIGALRARPPSRDVTLLALTVLGITVFTLVFQGRSRYLLTFVPLVVALGAMVRRRLGPPRRLSELRARGTAR